MAEEPKKTERAPTQMRRTDIPPDTILIGKKPIMAYATAVMMHYNTGAKKLTLKARGRAISTAVDVAEVVNVAGALLAALVRTVENRIVLQLQVRRSFHGHCSANKIICGFHLLVSKSRFFLH